MKLKSIDKLLYRKRLNLVIVAFILGFGVSAVGFGQVLIHFFGDPPLTLSTPKIAPSLSANGISQQPAAAITVDGENHFNAQRDTQTDTKPLPEKPNNFRWNLLGVILGLLLSSLTLNHVKHSDFFTEIYYVWQLKQIHNRIYRKLTKIKKLASSGHEDSYIVLYYYYVSLKSVYELDDNTLVISRVNKEISALEDAISQAQFTVNTSLFSEPLLASVEQQLSQLKPI